MRTRTRPTWKQLCAAGHHRFRGKEHGVGCPDDWSPHMHVMCRRCRWWWMEMMLFDPGVYADYPVDIGRRGNRRLHVARG